MKIGIFGTMIVLALLANASFAEITYSSHKVARIEFGTAASQLGVSWVDPTKPNPECVRSEGVRGLTVDNKGNIFIGDILNGKIKKFSKSGKLIAATEGDIYNIQAFAVDKQGNIIVHSEDEDSRVTKFSNEGKRLWSHLIGEIIKSSSLAKAEKELNIELSPGFAGYLSTLSDGRIVMGVLGRDIAAQKSKSMGMMLNADGKFIKLIPGFGRDCGGLLLWRESTASEEDGLTSVEAVWYDTNGKLVKSMSLANKNDIKTYYSGVRFGVSSLFCDSRGSFVTVSYTKTQNPSKNLSCLSTGSDILLNRYDANGKFIAPLRLSTSPVSNGVASDITVAPDGSIYHLVFDKKGVDVMVYKLQTSS